MENLLRYIHSIMPFSQENWDILRPVLTQKEFKRGEYLLEEGAVCNALFYIDRGYCRSFFMIDGTEKNTAFYFENDIATNIKSFGTGLKSEFAIKACEPLSVIVFDKFKLKEVSQKAKEIETLGKNCIRLFSTKQEEFANLFHLYNAEERLLYIEKNHPDMLQRISLTQLSSFLGVARETLSRIRKKQLIK